MNATTILMSVIKWLLGMKFGIVILIVVGVIFLLSLIKNIISGSFSPTKFLGGFNIFTGSIQGKLIYWGVLAILAFGLYHQLTRPTWNYDTDYKNNIKQNRDVYLDQRVGDTCTEKCVLAMQPFGFTLLKVGCVKSCTASITQQTKVQSESLNITKIPTIDIRGKKPVAKTSIFKKVVNVVKFPFNLIKKIARIK
jgi:hypothetical protein